MSKRSEERADPLCQVAVNPEPSSRDADDHHREHTLKPKPEQRALVDRDERHEQPHHRAMDEHERRHERSGPDHSSRADSESG
jgi:hypothetical protein